MYKGLHFDLKVASCYFSCTGFLFLNPFPVEQLRVRTHLKSPLHYLRSLASIPEG